MQRQYFCQIANLDIIHEVKYNSHKDVSIYSENQKTVELKDDILAILNF